MTFASLAQSANTRAVQRNTPIIQAIPGRTAEMAANNGGGFSFKLDAWSKLDRFLIIGTEGGTYYSTEKTLNADSLTVAKQLILENGNRVVDRCVEISQAARAKNNDYALLVMAMVLTHGNNDVKRYAASSLPLVARTGTHLMHFVGFANGMRGWGKQLKWAVQNWYSTKTPDQIAYQAIKYQQRDGWSQRDILRLAHPKAAEDDQIRNSVYKYIVKGSEGMVQGEMVPPVIVAFEQAKTSSKKDIIKLILDHRLSSEMIGNEHKNDPAIWEALYVNMGTTAVLRNLNKMTSVGLIKPYSDFSKQVISRLNDVSILKKDRIHPMQVLIAQKQYAKGQGDKGSLIWSPDNSLVTGLETTFYSSFQAVVPSGKNLMLALDVSASMNNLASGVPISCREAAVVMSMVSLRVEKNAQVFGFDHKFRDLGITANDTMASAMLKSFSRNFGSTNMSLPMQFAQQENWKVDCFSCYTDNEINTGTNHPSQALRNYRNTSGILDAKLIAVGMAVNGFTIADPTDKFMMDIVGFDSSAPAFISEFAAGRM